MRLSLCGLSSLLVVVSMRGVGVISVSKRVARAPLVLMVTFSFPALSAQAINWNSFLQHG